MGCGCGKKQQAAAASATPQAQAEATPFAFLVERGWRPSGGGEWVKGGARATARDAIAVELAAIEAAVAVAEMEVPDAAL